MIFTILQTLIHICTHRNFENSPAKRVSSQTCDLWPAVVCTERRKVYSHIERTLIGRFQFHGALLVPSILCYKLLTAAKALSSPHFSRCQWIDEIFIQLRRECQGGVWSVARANSEMRGIVCNCVILTCFYLTNGREINHLVPVQIQRGEGRGNN